MTDTDRTISLLDQIPALAARLPRDLTGATPKDSEPVRSVPGSRPPINVDLLDLREGRHLEWWVMLAIDEMTELGIEPNNPPSARVPSITDNCTWLARNAPWIASLNPDVPSMTNRKTGKTIRAFTGFASDIQELYWSYRRAVGDIPGPKIKCPECGNRAAIDGEWVICYEVDDHARTVKSIENEHRYVKVTTAEVCERLNISEDRIYQWKRRGKLHPAEVKDRKILWWEWDIFLLLNPSIAEALEARDTATAG